MGPRRLGLEPRAAARCGGQTLLEERMGGDEADQMLQSRRVVLLGMVARRHVAAVTWKLLMCFKFWCSVWGNLLLSLSSSTEWPLWPQALGASFAAQKYVTLLQLWLSSTREFSFEPVM